MTEKSQNIKLSQPLAELEMLSSMGTESVISLIASAFPQSLCSVDSSNKSDPVILATDNFWDAGTSTALDR